MAVLIDEPIWWFKGRRWSHLVSDVSYDELHAFAERAGIPRRGFQGDHYDVPEEHFDDLVVAEAHVGKALVLKRFSPRGRGRMGRIMKPFSHLTIVVREVEEAAPAKA